MTAALLEQANEQMRQAVRRRLEATDPSDEKLVGYQPESCCEGQRFKGDSLLSAAEVIERFNPTHPTSQAFYELCDALKEMHSRKSRDYGSADDPLANIRNGAEFVGIEPWRAAMVRLSDKVTRLATYCRTGSLTFEGVEDTLFDLASYSLLTLLTHREACNGRPE
jgi:hypothetical protein